LLDLYALGLLVYVILSWVQNPSAAKVSHWLGRLYLPLLNPLRSVFKPVHLGGTALDLSPLVLFLAIAVVRRLLL
jgi:uncharacterized protein YggT (Ycf19 family)